MLRARTLVVPLALITALSVTSGCSLFKSKKKVNPEIRTPHNVFAEGGDTTSGGSKSFGPGSPWGPGGAPGLADGSNGINSTVAGMGTYDPATNGLVQNANTNGIEMASEIADLDMVHFDYDRSELKPEWETILNGHAEWLRNHPGLAVQIEGHCDEQGTEEYNMALGQKRADSVREYLVSQGIDATRLSTISYGKLRPLSFDVTTEANALNRRAMFLVYSPDPGTQTANAGW